MIGAEAVQSVKHANRKVFPHTVWRSSGSACLFHSRSGIGLASARCPRLTLQSRRQTGQQRVYPILLVYHMGMLYNVWQSPGVSVWDMGWCRTLEHTGLLPDGCERCLNMH